MGDDYREYMDAGYTTVSISRKYVMFEVPKKFNWYAFIVLIFFFNIFGLTAYLAYYQARGPTREVLVKKSGVGTKYL